MPNSPASPCCGARLMVLRLLGPTGNDTHGEWRGWPMGAQRGVGTGSPRRLSPVAFFWMAQTYGTLRGCVLAPMSCLPDWTLGARKKPAIRVSPNLMVPSGGA